MFMSMNQNDIVEQSLWFSDERNIYWSFNNVNILYNTCFIYPDGQASVWGSASC